MLSDNVYSRICTDTAKIFKTVKPTVPDTAEVPVLQQLLEIETFIEECALFQSRA